MMNVILYVRFVITVLSTVMITNLYAWAIDESKVAASAEKIAKSWEELLPKKKDKVAVYSNTYNYWKVREFDSTSVEFDVQKTDSIVSPYILIVSIGVICCENVRSPNANGYMEKQLSKGGLDGFSMIETKVFRGFKTKEEALSYTDRSKDYLPINEFKSMWEVCNVNVYYSYRGKFWEYKGFKRKDGKFSSSCEEELLGGYVDINHLDRPEYFSKLLKDLPIN